MHDSLVPGVYESVLTQRLQHRIDASSLEAESTPVGKADVPHVFAKHIATAVERHLTEFPEDQRLDAANAVLTALRNAAPDIIVRSEVVTSVHEPGAPTPERPVTPLSEVALLTNTRDEPNMASEIARELGSADRVDLLCAFIRFAGIAVIRRQLEALRDRGVHLRVITTTYRGATERRALDELVYRYGAEVRVRYETASTRLHAKAWLFRRNSGFDTGYVGSSNLSRSALVDGLEWNVRISSVATPTLVRKFEATFDTYWNDPGFIPYDPSIDGARLDKALAAASGTRPGDALTISGLDVQPYPHQERILEALDVAREVHDQHRNLVVAATGTGKTVVAALDYKRLCEAAGKPLTLLFVAHRKEILEQSMRKYREVLGDGSFGELYVDGSRPTDWKHVFASIQSLNSKTRQVFDLSAFDVVVVDEFHHAAAKSYVSLLSQIGQAELLGLTATPERSDSLDILSWFGGRPTYELRLWDALEQDLLCPFHYFGISDNTDLRDIAWSRGDYRISDLENVYTGNDARTRLILNAVRDYVANPLSMRALGFCVSIAHAEYMAHSFSRQGVPARAVSAETNSDDRARAFADLRSGAVKCLFAVDIFNEGVDLPDVDTLLMLRPTQSATVFLQQLGRGLRRSRGKAVLTVLDFIGHHRAEFNFAPRFTALTGERGKRLVEEVSDGFPYLPGASRIVLDRQAQNIVLESIKRSLPTNRKSALVASVRDANTTVLGEYLDATGAELSDVYGGSVARAWTSLLRDARLLLSEPGPAEYSLARRVRALAHVDDLERIELYRRLIEPNAPTYAQLSPRKQVLARMLFFTLWSDLGGFTSYDAGFSHLRAHRALCVEISQLLDVAVKNINHVPRSIGAGVTGMPLYTHAHYRREEVLAAIGFANLERKARGQAGGVTWHENTGALFVTLHKNDREFSPTTMYRDFPISRELFHWESPNNTAEDSEMGRRYIEQRTNGCEVLLFVREHTDGDFGAEPYMFLGNVDYVSHRGERPIAITWKLRRPMPIDLFESGAVVAS